jgi:REP element-mobilizing transposase RayT
MKYEPLTSGKFYHIFNKGNNNESIFIEEGNYNYFLSLLKKHVLKVCDVYSYCLLSNHFHLLIRTKDDVEGRKISQHFSNLFNAYSKAINKKYNRTGSLFRDRFKRKEVTSEAYLKNLVVYINLNPIYHSLVSNISEIKHSSLTSLLSNKAKLLKRNEVLEYFNDRDNFLYHLEYKKIDFDSQFNELIFE